MHGAPTMDHGWSVEDKKKLLMALQQCGSDIFEVQKQIPHKSVTEIRIAFDKYARLALNKTHDDENFKDDDSAIDQWIKLVRKTHVKGNTVYDIIPRALKYIALFEKRPKDVDVNLSDCYKAISDMSNGVVSKQLNPTTSHFFYENLSRLALQIKQGDNERKKKFIRDMKDFDNILKPKHRTYNKAKKKVNSVLNPLNVPDELLKINGHDTGTQNS